MLRIKSERQNAELLKLRSICAEYASTHPVTAVDSQRNTSFSEERYTTTLRQKSEIGAAYAEVDRIKQELAMKELSVGLIKLLILCTDTMHIQYMYGMIKRIELASHAMPVSALGVGGGVAWSQRYGGEPVGRHSDTGSSVARCFLRVSKPAMLPMNRHCLSIPSRANRPVLRRELSRKTAQQASKHS